MSGRISDHIRSNVWAIVACFLAVMGTAVVAGASDGGPQAAKSASTAKQVKQLKRKLASVENRLAALEGKPGTTIPTSLPPSGPASGELAGSYPSPTIGTVSGLDLASSGTSTGGINFGADTNLYRASANLLRTTDDLDVIGDIFVTEVTGFYVNTGTSFTEPGASACDEASERGRMFFETDLDELWVCDATAQGWRTIPTVAP